MFRAIEHWEIALAYVKKNAEDDDDGLAGRRA